MSKVNKRKGSSKTRDPPVDKKFKGTDKKMLSASPEEVGLSPAAVRLMQVVLDPPTIEADNKEPLEIQSESPSTVGTVMELFHATRDSAFGSAAHASPYVPCKPLRHVLTHCL